MSGGDGIESAKNLFTETGDGPRLLGSRCATCGTPYFPRNEICRNPDCAKSDMQEARFGPSGTLFSVALQNYPPPAPTIAPDPYRPYGVGLVDLPEGLRVLGRLRCDDPMQVEPGTAVELVIAPLGSDAEGREVISWQWKPR